MNLAEIQYFKQVGKRLRSAREMRGLSLTKISGACGLGIQELVRVENGELMGFKQISKDTLKNAEIYANALQVELGGQSTQHPGEAKINNKNDDVFIPVFLRKK
jgi:transcriptional regulator with XRE-family HTH domain